MKLRLFGDDGLTWWQRRRYQKQWERTAGAMPTAEQIARMREGQKKGQTSADGPS